jgi:hypothetical protein
VLTNPLAIPLVILYLLRPEKQNPNQVKSYAEIVDSGSASYVAALSAEMEKSEGEEEEGEDGGGSGSGDDLTADGFGLNGPKTVRRKVAWAKSEGLAGVMFWELGQDKIGHGASLVAAAANASGIGISTTAVVAAATAAATTFGSGQHLEEEGAPPSGLERPEL